MHRNLPLLCKLSVESTQINQRNLYAQFENNGYVKTKYEPVPFFYKIFEGRKGRRYKLV